MNWQYNDGGRSAAGYKGSAKDCTVRAIAIATGTPYREVYAALTEIAGKSPRLGTPKEASRKYLAALGWKWTPTMGIGTGCRVHLHDGELPGGRLVVKLSKHLTAVVDGVIHDTYDPRRSTVVVENGVRRIAGRCVYGFWRQS